MNNLKKLLELISIDKQLRMFNDGFDRTYQNYGVVSVKRGIKFYVIVIDSTVTYRIDKQTLDVYDFYKKYVGSVESLIRKYQERIVAYPKRMNFQPKVIYKTNVKVVAPKGYVGRIFYNSWGYDQTNNDFVQVVSETDKQVRVRKLAKSRDYDSSSMTGVELPKPKAFTSDEFILIKDTYRGKEVLRGTDKSGSGSSQSSIWEEWDGKSKWFSSYA